MFETKFNDIIFKLITLVYTVANIIPVFQRLVETDE